MKSRLLLTVAALGMVLGIAGCTNTEDIGEWNFTVEVVGQDTYQFTNEDAAEIGPKNMVAAMKDGDDMLGEDTWRGILLYDLLDYYEVEDFAVISVEGADGSSTELDPTRIEAEKTGFAWMVNSETLDSEEGPIKFVNHNRGPKHWINQVTKITIIE